MKKTFNIKVENDKQRKIKIGFDYKSAKSNAF